MAQQPSTFIPDSFIPDEGPSSFVPDSFVPDETEDNRGFLERYPIARRFLTGPSKEELGGAELLGTPQSEGSILPSWDKQQETFAGGFFQSLYNDIVRPFGSPSGFVGSASPARMLPPKPVPRIQQMLPEGRGPGLETDPFIASPTGRVQRQSLITPQEDARLQGFDIGEQGPLGVPSEPRGTAVDLAELREQERLKQLFFTQHEQAGGTALELPDRPPIASPPVAGETGLGFSETARTGGLQYPLDFMPEAVRPRSAQEVTRALSGDDFAREVMPPSEGIEFINPTPERPVLEPAVRDLRGGSAAIEPGEPIIPSAPPRTRTAPHIQEQIREPLYEDNVNRWTVKNLDPVIPDASESISPILGQNKTVWRRLADGLLVSGEKQLERMGGIGTEIRKALSEVEYSKRELFNKFAEPFVTATKKLRPGEVENFVLVMDGTAEPMSPNVANAVAASRAITNQMGALAQQAGVHLKTPNGKIVPFKPMENYWPHRPVTPVARSSFIDELMRRNPKLSRSQAERLARQFQNESEFFNSPQHSRMFGEFEWRKDLNSMTDHMADMADIISRAKILGPGDIGVKRSLISQLIERAPDPAHAHNLVRTHLRGGLDKNDGFYQAVKSVNRLATKSQVFSKLGLFPISNLNNQLQTMLHGNLMEFAESFVKTVGGSTELKNLAKNYGTVSVGDLPVGILSEAGKRQVPIVGNLVKWAEDFARTVATGTGHGTAQAVFKNAKAGDKMSTRRLQNLLLVDDVSSVLSQSKLTPDQLKFATQRFVELAQQLDSGMKLPPVWVNEPLLHIPLIFKRFGFQGTKSIKDAILSNPGRNIPLFLSASPLLGELTGDLKSTVYGVIRGAPEPQGMLDAIAFELAGRHRFAERVTHLDSEESDLNWLVNRLTADILQSWGLGLIADMLQGALGGKNAGYSAVFGPAIDQALSVITSVGAGDVTNLGREGLRSIPVLGPGLQRRLLPTQTQEMP